MGAGFFPAGPEARDTRMKFMSFTRAEDAGTRIGVEMSDGVLDLTGAGEKGQIHPPPGARLDDAIRSPGGLRALRATVLGIPSEVIDDNRVPRDAVRYRAPVTRPEKIIGIGLNYRDHAQEFGTEEPTEPILFAMWANTITGPGDPIVIPSISDRIDYEAELGVVIGRRGRHVPAGEAEDFIAGYTIVNDVTARDLQMKDSQWVRGKSFDAALPIGPVLVTPDALGDGDGLDIRLRVNGQTLQTSNTRHMIFKAPELVAFVSEGLTLEPGDIIATGTPGGVGFKRRPPVFLKPGDAVEIELEGIGTLRNPVTAESDTAATARGS